MHTKSPVRPLRLSLSPLSTAIVSVLVALVAASPAKAASSSWISTSGGVWSNTSNWNSGIIADGAGFTADLTTNITSAATVTLDTSRSIGVLNIGDTVTTSGSYLLDTGTNTLTFDNGASDAQLNQISTSNGDTISGLVAIGGNGNLTVTNAASGKTLTISAAISSALASGTQTLTFNSANAVTAGGIISNGTSGGTVGLVKSGAGTLTLGKVANSFTGGLVIKSGTVAGASVSAVGDPNSFGANANVITIGDSSGGNLSATLSGGVATYLNPIVIASTNTGTATITTSGSGNTVFNGAVSLNTHDLTALGAFTSLTLGGNITGTGNLTLNAASSGIVKLNGSVNNVGTVTNTGAGSPSNGNVIAGVIGANVTGIIQDSSTATLALFGNNSSYVNGILIKKGTVTASGANSLGGSANVITLGDSSGGIATNLLGSAAAGTIANAIQVASGNTGSATLGSTFSNAATFSGLITMNSHDLTLSGQYGALAFSGGFASTGTGGNLTINSGGTNTIALSGGGVNHAGSITHSGASTGTAAISSIIGANVTGVIQNSATSMMVLSGANTYTGATTVSAGTLRAGVASVANTSGAFGKNSAVTMANVASAVLDLNGNNTQIGSITGGGATGGNVTLGAGTLTTGGNNASPAAYAGIISGTGGLSKIGTGTQILTGASTYTGATTVTAGTLLINGMNSAATGAVFVDNTATLGGNGTVGGAATFGAGSTLSAGASAGATGTLAFSSTVDLSGRVNSGMGGLVFDLNAPGTNDMITLTGGNVLTLGTLDFNDFTFNNLGSLAAGTYTLFDTSAAILGSLGFTTGSIGSFTGTLSFANSNNDLLLTIAAVPEPSAYALLGLGLGALGILHRRRSRVS